MLHSRIVFAGAAGNMEHTAAQFTDDLVSAGSNHREGCCNWQGMMVFRRMC